MVQQRKSHPGQFHASIDNCSVSITIGILISYWIDYGTNYIGGSRCAPNVPYTGGTPSVRTFNAYHDVPPGGCTGQSEASWRLPLAIQIVPAIILGVGMLFFPDTPRWLLMKERDDDSLRSLSKLRRQSRDSPRVMNEYLEIKASIMLENTFAKDHFPNLSGLRLHLAQVRDSLGFGVSDMLTCLIVHDLLNDMVTFQKAGYWLLCDVLPAVHGLQWYVRLLTYIKQNLRFFQL